MFLYVLFVTKIILFGHKKMENYHNVPMIVVMWQLTPIIYLPIHFY